MQTTQPSVLRRGLVERIERSPRWCVLIAPPGYGKSHLLRTLGAQWHKDVVDASRQHAKEVDAVEPLLVDAGPMDARAVLRWLDALPAAHRYAGRGVLAMRPPVDADALAERLGAHLTVVGASRLAFERDEVAAWANQYWGTTVDEALVDALHALTAGWPTLLERLAAHADRPGALAERLQQPTSWRPLWPFVHDELLARLDERRAIALQCVSIFHQFDLAAVAAVIPPDTDAQAVVDEAYRHGLVVTRGTRHWAFAAPVLREALRTTLEATDRELARRALERGARHLLEQPPRDAAAEATALLIASGRRADAAQYMAAHPFYLLESVSGRKLAQWLAIARGTAAWSPRLDLLEAHVSIDTGDLHRAHDAVERLQAALRTGQAAMSPEERLLVHAASVWGQARVSARRGRVQEAATYARRGMSLVASFPREGASEEVLDALEFVESGLLRVEARILLRAGRSEKARAVLEQLVERTSRPRAAHTARVGLLARTELAWLALRRGDVPACLEQVADALRRAPRRDAPEAYGVLKAIEAYAHAMRGDLDAAFQAAHAARSVLRMVGPEVRGSVLLAFGWMEAIAGRLPEAADALQAATAALDRGGDVPARAEARIRLADVLVELREFGKAIEHLEHIGNFASNIRRLDPRVAGMRDLVRARIALRQRTYPRARQLIEQGAMPTLERAGAQFELVAAHAMACEVALADERPGDAARHADEVQRRVDHHGYALLWPPSVRNSIEEAMRQTNDTARARRRVAEAMALHARKAGRRAHSAKALRVLTPQAVRILPETRLEQLLAAASEDTFVVVVRDNHHADIRYAGQRRTGDLRRVVLPLLRRLVERPDQGFTAPELVQLVWGDERFDARARTRLKVAISRLRDFLGPELAKHVVTTPGKGKDRALHTRYAITREMSFLWIEPADPERA